MSQLWQHPYVNVFKHLNISAWKRATKEGEVTAVMDKSTRGTVYKITGSIPAGNYIQLPKTGTQSLGLTGRYMYLLFKPIPGKYFVVHLDVSTEDNLVVRISFSNIFKEFKSTSTWIQFPFICKASGVHSLAAIGSKENAGPAPLATRWTVLCLDFHFILSVYLNRKFSHLKSIRLCSSMFVKNVMTSDILYEAGITLEDAKRAGLMAQGISPFPRDLAYPIPKGERWKDHFDFIRFPSESSMKPFDSIQHGRPKLSLKDDEYDPRRLEPKQVDVTKNSSEASTMIGLITAPKKESRRHRKVTSELPSVGVDRDIEVHHDDEGEVHIFAKPNEEIAIHRENTQTVTGSTLEPDPILKLKRIVGFGGSTFREALWCKDGTYVVYPCHAVVVAMKVSNGHQRFFIGHTDKVCSMSMNGSCSILATGQTGQLSVVRIWKFYSGECLAMVKTHAHSLISLSFSHKGNILCGVGKDGQGKNMVVIWNTAKVTKSREVNVMAKAHTDVDVVRMKVAAFDDTRMVSCGRDNIRLWRVKENTLRSAPINLGEYHLMEFTDICFEAGYHSDKDPCDRLVYACSKSGHIFEIDYKKVTLHKVRRLLPAETKSKKEKQTQKTGSGISINSMSVNETFCVTGSDDGYLRLWPLDFAHVYLEAEHEGPVTAVDFSSDGLKILAGTGTGNVGILDISTRAYTTIMRGHTSKINCVSVDSYRKHIATVADDHTIRVWDSETLQQVYDFSSPEVCPCSIVYHPSRQIFACGFDNGIVRIFNISNLSILAEHRQHRGKITGLVYSPVGDYLYSSCSQGSVAMYNSNSDSYDLLRLLGNLIAQGEHRGPDALAVSPCGRRVALIGPTEYTVTILEAKTLDEVLRIDITNLSTADNTKTAIDTAVKVYYSPASVGHLIVTTSNHKLLKFDARTGKILSEADHIHRSGCSSLTFTDNGKYFATAGDKVIKVWDYQMKLDINFQVFIGHSENVSKIVFTPDEESFISVGEAVFIWDFLARRSPSPVEGRFTEKNYLVNESEKPIEENFPVGRIMDISLTDVPRASQPIPTLLHSPEKSEEFSSVPYNLPGKINISASNDREEVIMGPEFRESDKDDDTSASDSVDIRAKGSFARSPQIQQLTRYPTPHQTPVHTRAFGKKTPKKGEKTDPQKPIVYKHFVQRMKAHSVAQRRYTAPPNQAGIRLKSVIGYNGNGRGNMVWHPDTGLFIYTSGCVIVIEDLNTGNQRHLMGHTEEISTIVLQNDCQVLASASGAFKTNGSQICIWDLNEEICKKTLTHHEHDIVCLAYSRDDRFLISVGDYRECSVVVWNTYNYTVLTSSNATHAIHDLKWDPYAANEFVSVGENGTILFWLLDETTSRVNLNVHECKVPDELLQTQHMGAGQVDFTCLEFTGESTLYVGTNNGKVAAWDTRNNSCFMHWEADTAEIGYLLCKGGLLLTASGCKNVRLWSIAGVNEIKAPGELTSMRYGGLTMEDEMNVDGSIVSVAFDENMDMGIVGTNAGTLWYINWAERTSIRLVSSHMKKINALSACDRHHLASCSDDGSLRIWSVEDREQALQFQVKEQACTCLAFAPPQQNNTAFSTLRNLQDAPVKSGSKTENTSLSNIAAGYSDGTVRMFDVSKVEMVLKMHPHAVSVTAISFSSDGSMIISGGSDGLIAVGSPTTGMTVRVINDHKGAPIINIDVTSKLEQDSVISAPLLWLATSGDRRVSIWSADWSKDFCELVDWLTFPAPGFTADGSVISKNDKVLYNQNPPDFAKFSLDEPDIIIYTGYGMQKQIQFYSMSQRKVVRTAALTHWCTGIDLAPDLPLIAIGSNERLLKLMDYYEGSFQDYVGHDDSVHIVKFSPDAKHLFSVSHSEIFIWEVTL